MPANSRLPLAAARVVDAAPRLRYRRAAGGGGGGIRSTERAWATLRAAAGTVAGIARDAALPQDPPWHGGGGGEGALRYGRHAGDSGGGAYRPAGSAGLVDVRSPRRAARPGRDGERRRSAARSRAVARVMSGPPAGGVHSASISATLVSLIMPGCASAAKRRRGRSGANDSHLCRRGGDG